jgi:Domain of Unknown Function (DUF1080)
MIFMKLFSKLMGFCGVMLLAGLPAVGEEAVAIFNGTDLTGWKVPAANPFWKVEGGVLTGKNDEGKKGSMLWTEKEYGDFELEAEAKWTGEIDSGFMLRRPELQLQIGVSRSLKTDMTGCFYLGGYPEEGRAKERATLVKVGEWNVFKIRAKGDRFTVWINGTEAVSYQNAKFAAPGPLGLQIHAGLAMEVSFRNLKVKALAAE